MFCKKCFEFDKRCFSIDDVVDGHCLEFFLGYTMKVYEGYVKNDEKEEGKRWRKVNKISCLMVDCYNRPS